jgi:hypothetical protein
VRYRPWLPAPVVVPSCPLCWQGDEYVVGAWFPDPVFTPLAVDGARQLSVRGEVPELVAYRLRCGHDVQVTEYELCETRVTGRVTHRLQPVRDDDDEVER